MRAAHLLSVCSLAIAANTAVSQERFQAIQAHMGARFEIVLYAECEETAEAAFKAAFARAAALDDMMSDYDPNSELSQLSKSSPSATPTEVSDDLWKVLAGAQSLSQRTDGAFDITVGPLTRLWRRARRQKKMPAAERIALARHAVGFQHLQLDRRRKTVTLAAPNMRLDLGGIAKGYAADAMLTTLADRGITSALVNAGGDVTVGESPPGESGWRIGITALGSAESPTEFVLLAEAAVATSGDAWQYVVIDGVRYSHILDPRTGLGTTRRGGVTVIAPDGMTSDSLASALSVLNVTEGVELIEQTPGASAMFVWLEGEEKKTHRTRSFPKTVK